MKCLQLTYRKSGLAALASLAVLASSSAALAQDADPPVIQPLPPEPASPPPSAGFPPAPPAPAQGEFVAPPPMEPPPPAEVSAAPAGLKISAFVDAFYGFQTAAQGTPSPAHRSYDSNTWVSNSTTNAGFAQNGFGLSFAGIDATYDGGQLGATINLRAGPSVPIFYAGDAGPLGIDNIMQAFATWTPVPQLSIDVGQFATIFGAEVADSWKNLNYTRGGLYYAMQPAWHTGMRIAVSPNDKVTVTGMVVNGANSIHDDNESPSLALQLSLTPNELFSLAVGGYMTPKPSTDGGIFDKFFDLVAALTIERFSLILNADLCVNGDKHFEGPGYVQDLDDPMFWGVSLAAGYQATDLFGIALRGELLSDSDNQIFRATRTNRGVTFPTTQQTNVVTVTGTLDFKPVEGSNNLVIRWDNRIETSNEDIFYNRQEHPTNVWFGSTLGVVVTTDG